MQATQSRLGATPALHMREWHSPQLARKGEAHGAVFCLATAPALHLMTGTRHNATRGTRVHLIACKETTVADAFLAATTPAPTPLARRNPHTHGFGAGLPRSAGALVEVARWTSVEYFCNLFDPMF